MFPLLCSSPHRLNSITKLNRSCIHFPFLDFSHPTNITEKICHLYRTREKRLLPVPWLEDFSFHMNDIFTRLKIVGKEKTQGGLTDDITNMTAIFKAHAECQRPRTVLIEGDPGMGKTTYCQKLAYDWATKQGDWDSSFPEIEVLLFLKCHEIKSDIWKAIDDQLLPEEMDDQAKKRFFKFIRENQSKVLLVLDGLDEADPRNRKMFFNLVQGKELSDCFIVLTARHEAGREVRRYCDTLWEIVGFTKEDAKSFIQKYFKNIHKEDLARTLIEMVCPLPPSVNSGMAKELEGLTRNPLNTALLCVMWEDFEGVFPKSRTQLYIEIVLCVLRRYEQKQGLSSENEDLLSVYKEDLLYLGEMALLSLHKGELYFEEHKSDVRFIAISKFGFLSLQAANSKREVRVRYAFLHKSFQEFFSGFYLACKLIEGDIDCESVVTDHRYNYELKQVFLFFTGILASTSEQTSESLVKSMAVNINFVSLKSHKDVSERVLFALESLSEYPSLLRTLGEHLNFTDLYLTEGTLNDDDDDDDDDDIFVLWRIKVRAILLGNSDAVSVSQVLAANSSLTSLDLSGNAISQSGASCLSHSLIANSSLTSLYLSGNIIGDDGASCLSQSLIANSSLTTLDLSGCSISQSGASCLSHALITNSSLTSLYLCENDIGDDGAACLTQALKVNCYLTNLDVSENGISESGASFFSQVLSANSSLTRLCLRQNRIGVDGASSLFKALAANSSLTSFDLSRNSIGEDGAACFSQALAATSSLSNLDLSRNSIGEDGVACLSQALAASSSLSNLDLRGNRIGDGGAACLSQALAASSSLSYLDLSGNRIGNGGAACLSQALAANSSLSNLVLHGNSIGDDGAASLSQALKANSFLTNLNLRWNSICQTGASCLSQALSVNSSLTNLVLSGNRIGDGGAVCLSQALADNSSLSNLDLSGNGIGDDGAASLFQCLTANSSLTNLNLSSNYICESGTSCLVQAFSAISSLTSLDLSMNRIGDDGAVWLSKALVPNSSLTSLDLSMNRIGDDGAVWLSKALVANCSLTYLNLRSNRIGFSGHAALVKTKKLKKTVKVKM